METTLIDRIEQWHAAGLIDRATAERIRDWEARRTSSRGSRLGRLAFGFGGLLLAAGVLLFVAAHWAELSPWGRFALLSATVAALHLGGGLVASRSAALATTLHAVGTAALGAAIFLAGQAFNLAAHWPEGLLLWALGAACGAWLLRDWPQVLWLAVLVPAWLVSAWQAHVVDASRFVGTFDLDVLAAPPAVGVFLGAMAYLVAAGPRRTSDNRRALSRLGALVLLPAGAALAVVGVAFDGFGGAHAAATLPAGWLLLGWSVAVAAPLLLGAVLRGREAWPLAVAAVFAVAVAALDADGSAGLAAIHVGFLAACSGLAWWGLHDGHRLRINVAVVGFALTVLSFYFSSLFDKLGRALGLIVLGVLFLGGGWLLERTRRRLLDRMEGASP
ncbi:MAG TPA: DUF2157 domain-containing protein [Steroidobacteraceae bacterium]|nr:DUF2157 domain-containing protein [Steroidobacteraceae bacterium]